MSVEEEFKKHKLVSSHQLVMYVEKTEYSPSFLTFASVYVCKTNNIFWKIDSKRNEQRKQVTS